MNFESDKRNNEGRKEIEKIFGNACANQIKVAITRSNLSYPKVIENLEKKLGYKIKPTTFKSSLTTGSIRASLFIMILLVIDEEIDIDKDEILKYIRKHHDIDVLRLLEG